MKILLQFLCLMIAFTGEIHCSVQPTDTIFVMDATLTDPAECQCQKNIFIHLANYTYNRQASFNSRFGLVAYADTTVLLYRLLWPLDITRWNSVVNGMICTGGNSRVDLVFILAQKMFTKGGRSNSLKKLGIAVSQIPTVPYTTAVKNLEAIGVDIQPGLRTSSTVNAQTLMTLSSRNSAFVSSSYCTFLSRLPVAFPL